MFVLPVNGLIHDQVHPVDLSELFNHSLDTYGWLYYVCKFSLQLPWIHHVIFDHQTRVYGRGMMISAPTPAFLDCCSIEEPPPFSWASCDKILRLLITGNSGLVLRTADWEIEGSIYRGGTRSEARFCHKFSCEFHWPVGHAAVAVQPKQVIRCLRNFQNEIYGSRLFPALQVW